MSPMKNVESSIILDISMKAGDIVLQNGGETYRAEESIVHTAYALGAKKPSAFVTPTVVIFSFTDDKNECHTAMHRITNRVVNLRKLSQVNMLIRRLINREKQSEPVMLEGLLSRIGSASGYSSLTMILCAAVSSLSFAFVFGGNWTDAVAAFFSGMMLRMFLLWFSKLPVNSFISSLCSGLIISVMSGAMARTGLVPSPLIVTIAVLMQVVPGLALVNSIRDIIAGDLVSGSARLMEACMIAAALSVGSVFGLFLL